MVGSKTVLVSTQAMCSDSIGSNGQTSSRDSDCVLISTLNMDPQPNPEPDVVVLDPVVASPSHELAKN